MSLKVITGFKGAGKTCFSTSLAKTGFDNGRKIFSNYWLAFDYTPINLTEMLNNPNWVKDGIILIDEAQTFVDCRLAGSKKNRLFSYIMLQGRKRKIDLILTSQQLANLDIRIRRNVDQLYECTPLKKSREKKKKVLRQASMEEVENRQVDLILVEMTDFSIGKRMKTVFDPHPFFPLYDSDEWVDITE